MNKHSTNQPTMKTEAYRASSTTARKHPNERYLATRMTRSLSGVPFDCRSLYEVRRGRKNLMGDFPEIAVKLARYGAKPSDVLHPVYSVEREVLREHRLHCAASLDDVQREGIDAGMRLYRARLSLAANPGDKALREEAIEAAYEQRIATELEIAKLEEEGGVQ